MTKREITDRAKRYLQENNHAEALKLYRQAWDDYPEERSAWDALFSVKALRESSGRDMDWENEMLEAFPEDEKLSGIYSWLLYDRHIKNFNENDPGAAEPSIEKILELVGQQDKREEKENSYPCPATIGVMKLLKAYKKPNLNIAKTRYWLEKLAPEKLSRREVTFLAGDGQERESASDFENYCSIKTNLLLKTEQYEDCIAWCDKALSELPNLHYNNQVWFQRRKALSLVKLGRVEEAEAIFEHILEDKAGQKWFIQAELSEIYVEEKDYENGLKYAAEAALTGKDYDKKARLFFNMSRIYAWLGEKDKGKDHAKLVRAINRQFEYQDRPEYIEMYGYFGLEDRDGDDWKPLVGKCRQYWQETCFQGRQQHTGKIKLLHRNGKSGIITGEGGRDYFFSVREIINFNRRKPLENAKVSFYLKSATDRDGNPDEHAEHIEVLAWPTPVKYLGELKMGDSISGIVDGVAPFGLFIRAGGTTGLLHRSKIPFVSREDNLQDQFFKGMKVEVEVIGFKGEKLDLAWGKKEHSH